MSACPILIGHSHVHAPIAAAREQGVVIEGIAFWVEAGAIETSEHGPRFRADIAARLAEERPVFSFVGGNAHTTLSLVEHHRPFDLVLPGEPELPLDAGRECVPAAAVREALDALDARYTPILEQLIGCAKGPVMQVGPPPPVVSADATREKYPWNLLPDRPRAFAPAWLRLKVWRLAVELIAARCRRLGIAFLPSPVAAADANGFLKPEYRQDVAHANAAYGALLLRDWGIGR
jgi:hypothetical protein